MTDEEKKAINHLTKKMKYQKDNPLGTYVWLTLDEHYVRTILNLIEKQSKEIEELKNADLTTVYLNGVYDGEKKFKDKIKAKIEEEDKLFFKTKDVRHANRYKAYKELLEKE